MFFCNRIGYMATLCDCTHQFRIRAHVLYVMETGVPRTFVRRDRYRFYNTLAGLVKALENKEIVIDLRNDSCVYGCVVYVDGAMNVEMENAIFCDPDGNQYKFKNFHIQCRNIRNVQIPKKYPAKQLFEQQLLELKATSKNWVPKQIENFKGQRARRYNREILEEHYNEPGPSKQPPSQPN